MTVADFKHYLTFPGLLNASSLKEVDALAESHPWYATAQLLLAKNLLNTKHIRYQARLKMASTATIDRKLLKQFLLENSALPLAETQKTVQIPNLIPDVEITPSQNIPAILDVTVSEPITTKEDLPDAFVADPSKVEREEIPLEKTAPLFEIFPPTNAVFPKKAEDQNWIPIPFEPLLQFDYTAELLKLPEILSMEETDIPKEAPKEKMSFSDWLKHSKGRKEILTEKTDNSPKTGIIEKFITEQPRITKPKQADFFKPQEAAKKSLSLPEGLVTETLAQIYEQQGHFDRAIRAYEKLTVKHPEKFTYFAARISKLKERLKD
jgi:hypothetical protein